MSLDQAFDEYQKTVDADPTQVTEARERRDIFKAALGAEDDVAEVWGSGSLRRSTHTGPLIHDLDLVVVFDRAAHPGWGEPGNNTAADSLDVLHDKIVKLLGNSGTVKELVRRADPRRHAVKCFIDLPGAPEGFTVDAMPALNHNGALLIPEKTDADTSLWVPSDPQHLVREIARRSRDWDCFLRMVRVVKKWRRRAEVEGKVKSLVMEVLALHHLPAGSSRPDALRRFFTAAATAVGNGPVTDPADLCGEIQPDLDRVGLQNSLLNAADLADQACDAAANGYTDDAKKFWREVFGSEFPAPKGKANIGPTLLVPAVAKRPIKDAPQG
ncbi:MAG TPA: nucleotidyltransferase [Mycobacterium sp.]|nr:nucleotidyltransferase [Mycobacterium sp.]